MNIKFQLKSDSRQYHTPEKTTPSLTTNQHMTFTFFSKKYYLTKQININNISFFQPYDQLYTYDMVHNFSTQKGLLVPSVRKMKYSNFSRLISISLINCCFSCEEEKSSNIGHMGSCQNQPR